MKTDNQQHCNANCGAALPTLFTGYPSCQLVRYWERLKTRFTCMWHVTEECKDVCMSVNYDWRSVCLFFATGSLVKVRVRVRVGGRATVKVSLRVC